jgi:hypothetical protein
MKRAEKVTMSRALILLFSLLWLAACGDAPDAVGTPDAPATTIAEVDQGQTPVVVFQRSGENPGQRLEWRIYGGGRLVALTITEGQAPAVSEDSTEAQNVELLIQELQQAGFFGVAQEGEQECCDSNDYVLSVRQDGQVRTMAIEQITPQVPVPRLQSLNAIERFIFEAFSGT